MPTFLRTSVTANVNETTDAAAANTTTYSLQVGQVFGGGLTANDRDWIAVSLTAGQTYNFGMVTYGFSDLTNGNNRDTYLRLFNSAGTQVALNDDGGPSLFSSLTYTATTTETYFIEASAFSTTSYGYYGLSMTTGTRSHYDVAMMGADLTRAGLTWASPTNITYGFRNSAAPYTSSGHDISTFSQVTAAQRASVQAALQLFADVSNISFQEVNPGGFTDNATMLFSNYYDANDASGAFAYYPGSTAATAQEGDVWLNIENQNAASQPFGSNSWQTIVHEIGHAVGLAHPGDYNAAPGVSITYAANAQFNQDSHQYTTMSYFNELETGANFGINYASTLMMADILALQSMYGINYNTRSGSTVYGYTSTAGSIYDLAVNGIRGMCIWDGGGDDYLVGSGYSGTQSIDLTEGSFSDMAGGVANVSIAHFTLIENAVGGTGTDYIYGNVANNVIDGNLGNDFITGDRGNDTMYGGVGLDTVTYMTSLTGISINFGTGYVYNDGLETTVGSGVYGIDRIYGFEQVIGSSFADFYIGSESVDYINGIGGDDYIAYAGAGNDVVDGGVGFNTMSYYDVGTGIFLNLAANTSTDGQGGTDYLINIQQVYGSNWAGDSLTGNANYNILRGFGGNDYLAGGYGSDALFGGTGSDHFVWGLSDFATGQWDTVQDFGIDGGFDYLDFYGTDVTLYETGGHTYIAPTSLAGGGGANVLSGGGVIVLNRTASSLAGHFNFG